MKKILLYSCLIAIFCLTALTCLHYFSKDRINLQAKNFYQAQINSLLTSIKYNNNILDSKLMISDSKCLIYLGKKNPAEIYIAKYNQATQAVIVNATAPDGYNGNINLLIAIEVGQNKKDFKILDIKILQHQETPGLGDFIEPEKSNWLSQFKNKFLGINPWEIRKSYKNSPKFNDHLKDSYNQFDSISGATITSKAVTKAIYNSLLLLEKYPTLCQI